jgi:hypothetical protein
MLNEKKQLLGKEFPEYLLNLLDLDGNCVACVTQSPDAFTLKVVHNDDSWCNIPWSTSDETIAEKKRSSVQIKAYYIFNSNRACACGNEPHYVKRADYDSQIGSKHWAGHRVQVNYDNFPIRVVMT